MSKTLKSIAGMSLGTLFSRLTGFVKWAALGAVLGFTPLADAYNLAHVLPTMVYELILGGILSAVFIPVIVEQLSEHEPKEAWLNISQVINAGLLVVAATTVVSFAASPFLVYIQTLKAQAATREQVLFFFWFFIPQIFFYGLSAIGGGVLNARGKFAAVAYAPVANNLVVIATLFAYKLFPWFGPAGLAIGTTLGVLAQALILLPGLKSCGFKYHFTVNFRHPAVVKTLRLSLPVILYVAFNQLNLTIQNNLAIGIQGGVSALQYAFAFYILPHGLLAVSIGTVLLPGLSRLAVKKEWESFADAVRKGISWSALAIIPSMVVLISCSFPIVQSLMQHGRFQAADSFMLARVLSLYSLGLFSFTLYLFLNRVFYSLQDTKTPTILNFIGNAFNSIFNLLVIGKLGVDGLALGHAAAYTLIALLSLWLIKARIREIRLRLLLPVFLKTAAASILVGLLGWGLSLGWQRWISGGIFGPKMFYLAVLLLVLAAVYLGLARLFRISELMEMFKMLRPAAAKSQEKYS
jgi:putative peptidoglycan lipid II flippase